MEPYTDREALLRRFLATREATEALAAPLSPEDQQVQSMPDCSPTKWHRGHTTWFFETFVLAPHGVAAYDDRFGYLFNSYYEAVGPRHARPLRGVLSRPGAAEVSAWRRAVDGRVTELLASLAPDALARIAPTLELGIAHEEQHQELLLTDIVHAFSLNALRPALRATPAPKPALAPAPPLSWHRFDGGLVQVGHQDAQAFAFDNEGPRHRCYVAPFELASRPVTVAELLLFVQDGGYERAEHWLSAGWDWLREQGHRAPGHARFEGGRAVLFGVDGEREADPDEPVSFVSWYEAEALARYLGARLPSEHEWELAASEHAVEGNLRESGALRPLRGARAGLGQLFGDVWEWTRSSYEPYPGYAPTAGALGEYNGKFMTNQRVLRGGSCFSNRAHLRPSYRNFWHPETRSQVTGLRLARDAR